jgi:hypothetical protein
MNRAYYSNSLADFFSSDDYAVLGQMVQAHGFELDHLQRDAWVAQFTVLKRELSGLEGRIYFEYSIPRMGKRVDVVAVIGAIVFVIEFKVGQSVVTSADRDQVTDYGLDLKNFHEESHSVFVAPILVLTKYEKTSESRRQYSSDKLLETQVVGETGLRHLVDILLAEAASFDIDGLSWEGGGYKPTPTIIEATLALYNQHSVIDISRTDAGAVNLAVTSKSIDRIIDLSRQSSQKSIVFVTGVPGAGKTLVGLNTATKYIDKDSEAYSVFLSGNGPLVAILQEALAQDKKARTGCRIGEARSEVKAFIQNVHHFRDDGLADMNAAPIEHVALFDEAQRAWDEKQTTSFMKTKKGIPDFNQSEPTFLISCMDRHSDWAVIVCLVGGGQEINKGEAGIIGWIDAVEQNFPRWKIYASDQLVDSEYGGRTTVNRLKEIKKTEFLPELHLKSSMRSFRSENVSLFVKQLLDLEVEAARETLRAVSRNYPIVLTRKISDARAWLKEKARGTERFGIVVSSQAERLRPIGIHVKSKVDPVKWFLETKDHVRSSYYLEEAATEFDVQGLELDWACVAWDADFRHTDEGWRHWSFRGKKWQRINKHERKNYQKNAYRVLLTRARQGMVICVPEGDSEDHTREGKYYDATYEYLVNLGVQVLR